MSTSREEEKSLHTGCPVKHVRVFLVPCKKCLCELHGVINVIHTVCLSSLCTHGTEQVNR